MNPRIARVAALVAGLTALSAALAAAAESDHLSEFTLPVAALDLAVVPAGTPEVSLIQQFAAPEVSVAGVHYQPRQNSWGRHPQSSSVTQIHLGFFDPDGDPSRRFLVGVRGGPMVDSHVQLGIGVDWAHQTDNSSSVSRTTIGPGGVPITVKQDLSRASTNFFPMMAFGQISGDDDMPVVPFFGAAGGYELMNLSAEDFQTGASFDATYGGWGWQLWGGGAIPLSGRSRFTGEVFINNADLGRDVTDDQTGQTVRESVSANGIGVRFGLAWGF